MIFSRKYDLALLLMIALAVRVAYCVSESDSVGPMASEVERAAACIARKGMVGDVFGEGTGHSPQPVGRSSAGSAGSTTVFP
jgi:hypothetical protein